MPNFCRRTAPVATLIALIGASGASGASVMRSEETANAQPPGWFLSHIEFLTQDTGRWFSDNTAYKNEDEPFETYGMVWEKGIGGISLKGILFGLRDGQEIGPFWEFRTVWHPHENRVHAYQWGADGTFGDGIMVATGENSQRLQQTFSAPDGTSFKAGHEGVDDPEGQLHTQSFDIGADGSWTKRRLYLWNRYVPEAD